MTKKMCTSCERSRPLDAFPVDARHADGRGSYCRECAAGRTRAWRKENAKAHREYHREYMRRRRKERAA